MTGETLMPLHEDQVDREGNLTDVQYLARTTQKIAELGDAGLHTIPDDVLAAATAKAQEGTPSNG